MPERNDHVYKEFSHQLDVYLARAESARRMIAHSNPDSALGWVAQAKKFEAEAEVYRYLMEERAAELTAKGDAK
jgi:hypothetical protein